jgi:Domain of unknown function (DUF2431)
MFSHETAPEKGITGVTEHANLTKDPLSSIASTISIPVDIFDWFKQRHGSVFLLGEGNFDFTRSLITVGIGARIASEKSAVPRFLGGTKIFPVDATRLHRSKPVIDTAVVGSEVDTFHWNFPFTGEEEHDESNESLILGTFHSMLAMFRKAVEGRKITTLTFSLTLQGDQFSRWNVLKSALRTGWRLVAWGAFDLDEFPGYSPRRADGQQFPADSIRFYEFRLQSDLISSDVVPL